MEGGTKWTDKKMHDAFRTISKGGCDRWKLIHVLPVHHTRSRIILEIKNYFTSPGDSVLLWHSFYKNRTLLADISVAIFYECRMSMCRDILVSVVLIVPSLCQQVLFMFTLSPIIEGSCLYLDKCHAENTRIDIHLSKDVRRSMNSWPTIHLPS